MSPSLIRFLAKLIRQAESDTPCYEIDEEEAKEAGLGLQECKVLLADFYEGHMLIKYRENYQRPTTLVINGMEYPFEDEVTYPLSWKFVYNIDIPIELTSEENNSLFNNGKKALYQELNRILAERGAAND
jgi:hypothetical protein